MCDNFFKNLFYLKLKYNLCFYLLSLATLAWSQVWGLNPGSTSHKGIALSKTLNPSVLHYHHP